MHNVYERCPVFENERFLLKQVSHDDCQDLLKVYSDKKSVPLFNSDNCNGDDFYYTTEERMKQAIGFWLMEYEKKYYVRWSVFDKFKNEAIGTIELFNRKAEDYFTDCGLLRLDLRSDYENEKDISCILELIVSFAFECFFCDKIATKAIPSASERIKAMKKIGFTLSEEKVKGHDNTEYGSYHVLYRV
ncbi:MAG: GNAT family N-acetyltransferase [Ruminiclostridium sp.]|nr:GNAT family N-acetyltransferase [Ruminiclostridium sp.]